ncbi:MAG: CHRD domain-containing protein [Gemmatimonadota bacterium]
MAVEVGLDGRHWGTPEGSAILTYSARHHTLTVAVQASGVTPGRHAAHIHLGACRSQGPIQYSLGDLVANSHGVILPAVRIFRHVTQPVPAGGWYLNIHQGNMNTIVSNGMPTILFRPLLCADISGR